MNANSQTMVDLTEGEANMWTRTAAVLRRIWQAVHRSADQRNTEKERARFWAEVRKGQDEAEQADRDDRD